MLHLHLINCCYHNGQLFIRVKWSGSDSGCTTGSVWCFHSAFGSSSNFSCMNNSRFRRSSSFQTRTEHLANLLSFFLALLVSTWLLLLEHWNVSVLQQCTGTVATLHRDQYLIIPYSQSIIGSVNLTKGVFVDTLD